MKQDLVPVRQITTLTRAVDRATEPAELIALESQLEALEHIIKKAGLYNTTGIRPVNEARLRARWKLGRLLAKVERGHGPGRGKKVTGAVQSFLAYLDNLKLGRESARLAQRLGCLPENELEKAFTEARRHDVLTTVDLLLDWARPYWYQASREQKHREIARTARQTITPVGPFPLIYADPPMKFEIYSELGGERTPDQHYPTLTDEEIINFTIGGLTVPQIAHEDAALFYWCTSSNQQRATAIVEAWDFTVKTSAVWDKGVGGTGLVFRNHHEVLLYARRGNMPGPQYQPPSVFRYPRGRHSAKPPEIRSEIEKMYPDFDERTRLELFARGAVKGWTTYGFEAE